MTNFPIVLVKWRDAYSDNEGRELNKVAELPAAAIIHTVGFLVRKTKESLYLAQDYMEETPKVSDPEESWRSFTVIPRPIVTEIKVLRKRLT